MLGERLAKHLLRRTSFKINSTRIQNFAAMTAEAAVDQLFVNFPLQLTEPINGETGQPWINNPNASAPPEWKGKNYVKVWWINEAYRDESIISKITLFLHQYFSIHVDSAESGNTFDYLNLLRFYAKGSYRDLALKMVTDNMMSAYLDNRWNHKWNPNENFAREFFELFTIGEGPQIGPGNYTNYTEADIAEAARLLTGWRFSDRNDPASYDADTGLSRNTTLFNYHDSNPKTFSSAFNNLSIQGAQNDSEMWTELETFVDMIFDQAATAVSLCRRLYRFFVSSNITTEVENDIIQPLAVICQNNNYNIELTLKTLLKSKHFFNAAGELPGKVIGSMIKSPLDIVLHTMNFFGIEPPHPVSDAQNHYENFWWWSIMDITMDQGGFDLLEPNNVAGYPGFYQDPYYARGWFNSATIIPRYKVPEMFLTGQRLLTWGTIGGVHFDMLAFVESGAMGINPSDATQMVTILCENLFAETPNSERLDYYLNNVLLLGISPQQWTDSEWAYYQNTGDSSGIKVALNRLFTTLIYSQEFQLL